MSIILKMIYGIRHLRILGKMKLACVQRQPKLQVTMNKRENFLKGVLIKSLIHVYVLRLSCFNVQKKTLIWKTTTTTTANDWKNGMSRWGAQQQCAKVNKTLDGISEVMKQCVGILSNIVVSSIHSYYPPIPQSP